MRESKRVLWTRRKREPNKRGTEKKQKNLFNTPLSLTTTQKMEEANKIRLGYSIEPEPLEKYTEILHTTGKGDVKVIVDSLACHDDSEGKAMEGPGPWWWGARGVPWEGHQGIPSGCPGIDRTQWSHREPRDREVPQIWRPLLVLFELQMQGISRVAWD